MAETASILLRPNARIKQNVTPQTFPQPLTKCSCNYYACVNLAKPYFAIIYLIGRSRTLWKARLMCTRFANVSLRCDPVVFISMGLKITFSLDSCHGEVNINIHKAGMLCFATKDVLVVSSSSHPEVSREKVTLKKFINKVHFRCLITIWSIGIASRGFN